MTDITRRDFLNGAALTIAAGFTPAAQLAAQPSRYPPALTGMRGHHAGSFEVAHDLRDGKAFPLGRLPIEERYDLVVVGAASADFRPPGSTGTLSGRAPASSCSTTT